MKEYLKKLDARDKKEDAPKSRRNSSLFLPFNKLEATEERRLSLPATSNTTKPAAEPTPPPTIEDTPWVHREGPLKLDSNLQHPPQILTTNPREAAAARPRSRSIHREATINRGIQGLPPSTAHCGTVIPLPPLAENEEVAVAATIVAVDIHEQPVESEQSIEAVKAKQHQRPSPQRYYPIAFAMRELSPVPADIAAQFPGDEARAQVAQLALKAEEVKGRLVKAENEAERLREENELLRRRAVVKRGDDIGQLKAGGGGGELKTGKGKKQSEHEMWWDW